MGQRLRARLLCHDAEGWRSRLEAALAAEEIAVVAEEQTDEARTTVLLLDAVSPDALELVAEISQGGRVRVLVATTERRALTDNGGWQLLRAGASDAFCWTALERPAAHVAARLARWGRVDEALETPLVRRQLAGRSPRWVACLRQVIEIALFSDGSVLLLGESGTGKELLARLVHTLDPRPDKGELVVLDCTTVVPGAGGQRVLRPRARRLHGRGRQSRRRLRAGRRRHAVPRRGGRAAAGAAGAAAARRSGTHVQARRRERLEADQLSPDLRDPPRSAPGRGRRALPRRLLSPHRQPGLSDPARCATGARTSCC